MFCPLQSQDETDLFAATCKFCLTIWRKKKSKNSGLLYCNRFLRYTGLLKCIDQHKCCRLIDHFYLSVALKAIDLRGDSETNCGASVKNSTSVGGGGALTEDWSPSLDRLVLSASADCTVPVPILRTEIEWLRMISSVLTGFFHFLSGAGTEKRSDGGPLSLSLSLLLIHQHRQSFHPFKKPMFSPEAEFTAALTHTDRSVSAISYQSSCSRSGDVATKFLLVEHIKMAYLPYWTKPISRNYSTQIKKKYEKLCCVLCSTRG